MKMLYLPNEYSQQRQHEKKAHIYPILMAMEATWYRNHGHIVDWDSVRHMVYDKVIIEPEGLPFLELPKPDRVFTKAMDYAYDNGNFKYTPGTYIMSASGCWHGKCTFCVENGSGYKIRAVDDVIDEIRECKEQGYREIFDDSGTFPIGRWLDEFLTKYSRMAQGVRFSCNWRLCDYDYNRLYLNGWRMLLFGVESANQKTLDTINKGAQVEDIKYIKKAAEAGLENHIACMFGFPNEDYKDALKTLNLVHYLLRKGYAKTAQASILTPFPDTPLYKEYPEIKVDYDCKRLCKRIYNVGYNPEFWFHRIIAIRNMADLRYLCRGIKKAFQN